MSGMEQEGSEASDCSSVEERLETRRDRRARRVESNNRERRRMHELNDAFQVRQQFEHFALHSAFLDRPHITYFDLNGLLSFHLTGQYGIDIQKIFLC